MAPKKGGFHGTKEEKPGADYPPVEASGCADFLGPMLE